MATASFPSAILCIGQFHPRMPNLGITARPPVPALISAKAPAYLLWPLRFSTRTLASDGPKIWCSRSSHIDRFTNTNPSFWRRIVEGAVVVVFGSLLCLARFTARPVLALDDPQRSNFSASLEEKTGAPEVEDEVEMNAKLLEKNPEDVEALKVVLYGKLKKGKTKEAVRFVERLIDLEPDEVEWQLLQALCYELMGNLGKAKKLFKDLLMEWPLLIRALHGLALAMYKSGESNGAFEMLNKALKLAQRENRVTEEQNIKILIAQMHVVKGDLEAASQHFQNLINANPRDFRPYLCQGIVYSLLDKKKEAEEHFEIYRSLVPDELPQRSFIDDVILSAKTESQQFRDELKSEYSPQK
ncbi:protein SLOW GREEN 1, chloroplastic [Curcuma longa]|uniref:protein SLOW GREEN 1, chloroplastic n=1 Tax=Curcuma longa TaxID=136217 RepID=UPI003D9F6576